MAGNVTGSSAVAATMAFSTLTLARLFHGFTCRSHRSLFKIGIFSNLYTVMAFEAGIVLLAAVLFVPGLQRVFMATDMSVEQFCLVAVSYTHLTLPTSDLVEISVVPASLKKKKNKRTSSSQAYNIQHSHISTILLPNLQQSLDYV